MSIFLAIFYYFYFSIIGVYVIFIPKVLSTIGYSASEIGILLGAAPLVRFILPFLFIKGLKLDAKMFNLSLIILVIASLCFYLSVENFYQLLFSNIFLGIGLSLVLPYVEVISLENIGKQRYGKVRLFGSIGFIVVALVLAKFLSSSIVALNFLLTLTWITAVFAFIIGQRYSQKREQERTKETKTMSILSDLYLWGGLILMQVSFGSFYNFFTIYETDHGVSLDMTVYLWSFGVLVEIVMLFSQGKLLANSSLLNLIRLSVLASAFRWFLVFAYPENLAILFFSQSLHALSFALFHSATISYLYQIYHNKQLSQQFFMGLTYGLGGVSGAVIAGYIYEYYPSYLFLSSSVFALIGFVMLMSYKHRHEA
ncbi:MFS transporter [Sulfurimonas microaerophilic]|uniref:MFS transporter n=1 Tax=Sulfurimonas microaerophilic TaxID=3058392 RepID=UPI0027153D97|nr:MFS transporter [Sulfurimonas sp. hsl 1-7]